MTAEGKVPAASGRGPLTAVSWLDWKLGARMLLKHPALTIIGGLSLAAAIAIGAVGIEVAGELLYKHLRSMKAAEWYAWRRRTRWRHAWSRRCSTISQSGDGLLRRWWNSAPRA